MDIAWNSPTFIPIYKTSFSLGYCNTPDDIQSSKSDPCYILEISRYQGSTLWISFRILQYPSDRDDLDIGWKVTPNPINIQILDIE
jgi:hypothetical protein